MSRQSRSLTVTSVVAILSALPACNGHSSNVPSSNATTPASGGTSTMLPASSTRSTGLGGATAAVNSLSATLGGASSTLAQSSGGVSGAVTSGSGGTQAGGASATISVTVGGSPLGTLVPVGDNAGGSSTAISAGGAGFGNGGFTSSAGAAGFANGGSSSVAGAQSVGGSAVKVPCTLGKTDLIQLASSSPEGNWVGGEVTRNDDPCGFQGKFYAISDLGPDGAPGGGDDSLAFPAWVQGTTDYGNPCVGGRCCIRGTTSLWQKLPDGSWDYSTRWGAALVLSLSAIDRLDNGADLPYVGPAKGLRITLEGDLTGFQTLRFAFSQKRSDDWKRLAFVPFTSLGNKELEFEDVSCPSWAIDCTDTGYGGPHPYALWLMVAGGDDAGDFEVCVTSIVPI